jgi:hypothetical protein
MNTLGSQYLLAQGDGQNYECLREAWWTVDLVNDTETFDIALCAQSIEFKEDNSICIELIKCITPAPYKILRDKVGEQFSLILKDMDGAGNVVDKQFFTVRLVRLEDSRRDYRPREGSPHEQNSEVQHCTLIFEDVNRPLNSKYYPEIYEMQIPSTTPPEHVMKVMTRMQEMLDTKAKGRFIVVPKFN